MTHDRVDQILGDWARERPDLDASPIGVIGRVSRAARYLERELETSFRTHGALRALGLGPGRRHDDRP
jgi:hypothetical protein